jgi:hypothetical protein
MVPLDRTLEIVPMPRDSILDLVLPSLPLPLPIDAPAEGINGTTASATTPFSCPRLR